MSRLRDIKKNWYESVFNYLEYKGLCDIYEKNNNQNFFTYQNGYQYSVMEFYKGTNYSFDNISHLFLIKDFLKRLHNLKLSSDLVIDDEILITMPKQEINKWYINREEFDKNYTKKIRMLASELDVEFDSIMYAIERIDRSGLRYDYEYLKRALSHGEIQGQNLMFDDIGKCTVLDWDSISIRPAIYDIAMSACFLCRSGRGRFLLNLNYFESYIDSFQLEKVDRHYILIFMIVAFLPDINLLYEYYSFNPLKSKWYIDWSSKALQDIIGVIDEK